MKHSAYGTDIQTKSNPRRTKMATRVEAEVVVTQTAENPQSEEREGGEEPPTEKEKGGLFRRFKKEKGEKSRKPPGVFTT